ncbi:helix-turn-helix domain containing protein [Streptomyces sp. PA03-6a]|nr:helix-turn-helix domain containing protein [Streptomyces sp. PA03-6a]
MPARTPALRVEAQDPEIWSITGVDARTVDVHVWDEDPQAFVIFKFGLVPGRPLVVLSYEVHSTHGLEVPLKNLPAARWEKAARAAAERQLVAGGPYGQQVQPGYLAGALVDKLFPELVNATGGNELRRRNGLLHLAKMAEEYKSLEESGSSNPTQTLADKHGVSPATVRGWLHRARKEGLALESSHPNASRRQ